MPDILVFGAGGHGKVVLDILLESGKKVAGFLDEDKLKHGKTVSNLRVLGGWEYLEKSKCSIALGIGNNKIREKIYLTAKEKGIKVETCIHPKAVISKTVKIGEGSVVMAGAVINIDSVLKEGAVVNTSSSVDHDCVLEKFCQVWPGAHLAGTVTVGEYSYVGTGASVIQNIKIGKNTIIGAGTSVINDIPENTVAAGVPAKVLKENK